MSDNCKTERMQWLWVFNCGASILLMALLAWTHLSGRVAASLVDFCNIDAGWGCSETVRHPWSQFLWLPVPFWAAALYCFMLPRGPSSWRFKINRVSAIVTAVILAVSSVFFLFLIERDFSELCPLCLAVHCCHIIFIAIIIWGLLIIRPSTETVIERKLATVIVPFLVLLSGYAMTGWAAEKGFQRRLEKSLTRYSMLSTVLQQEFDRYYLEKNYHHIAGSNDAKAGLTIVGSLACRHCRRILQEIDRLPEEYLRKVRISFIPYPLASACNQRVRQEKDSHPERCLLAEQTIEALKKGEFRAWLAQVENAPGRILRRLRRQGVDKTTWDTDLTSMIDKTNSISVTSIPYLIWEGQKLPPLYGTLPLEDLIARMLRLREDRKNKQPESVEDCDC